MLISDVINDARYGELSNLSVQDDNNAILSYINMGLLELYKRFSLRTEEAVVSLNHYQTMYNLDSDESYMDMLSNCDVINILSIYEEDGNQAGMNNEDDPNSILTPAHNVLQVPNPSDGTYLSVIYTATPTRVTDPSDKLKLAPALYEALLHYIGYRAHGSVESNIDGENNTHYMRFENSCKKAIEKGFVVFDEVPYRPVNFKGYI